MGNKIGAGNHNRKGKKLSAEHRRRLIKLHTGNQYCLGRKLSPMSRKKMSLSKLGNKNAAGKHFGFGNQNSKGYKHTKQALLKIGKATKRRWVEWRKRKGRENGG
jgi:hypothetical protein